MTRSLRVLPLVLLVLAPGCLDDEDDAPPPPPIAAAPPATVPVAPALAPAATPPVGSVPMTVLSARPSYLTQGYTVLLADPSRTRTMPIYVGVQEGVALEQRLAGLRPTRESTHDLLDQIVRTLGGQVVMAEIHGLENEIFLGAVHVWDGQRTHRLEARTSDAITLALGHHAPLYVADAVLARASVDTAY